MIARRADNGEVAEWSKAAVLKTVDRVSDPGVRIPPSPPTNNFSGKREALWKSPGRTGKNYIGITLGQRVKIKRGQRESQQTKNQIPPKYLKVPQDTRKYY